MNKNILTLAMGLAFATGALAAGETPDFKGQKDKESYIIGYEYGTTLLSDGLRVNPEPFLAGLKQAQQGQPSALSPEEAKAAHRGLQVQVMAQRHREYLQQAEKDLEAGQAFLAENAKKDGVKTLPSGLQYKVLVAGSGPSPKETDLATMNYRGTLVDGTEFASSYARGRQETVDVNALIPGWREALPMMQVGSKWQVFVPTDLAYGQDGFGRIPPNSALIFEIELLAIGMPEASPEGDQAPTPVPAAATTGG
jgi:FKBP-type peptidyl-prolyl cis-trans isomerase FklB